jgi:hypothetical protein
MNLLVWDRSPLKTSGGAPFIVSLVPWGACPAYNGATACGWPPGGPSDGPCGGCPPGWPPGGPGSPWAPTGGWPPGGPCACVGEAGGAWPCCCTGGVICCWVD